MKQTCRYTCLREIRIWKFIRQQQEKSPCALVRWSFEHYPAVPVEQHVYLFLGWCVYICRFAMKALTIFLTFELILILGWSWRFFLDVINLGIFQVSKQIQAFQVMKKRSSWKLINKKYLNDNIIYNWIKLIYNI